VIPEQAPSSHERNFCSSRHRRAFPELFQGLRQLEGRFPTNEIAARIVNAAMAQPDVAGARLWRRSINIRSEAFTKTTGF
jgi:hypothetical protein